MADNAAIKSLHVAIGVDMSNQDIKKAETALDKLTDLATGLAGAFAAGKLINGLRHIIQSTAEVGNQIAKAAIRTGVAAEALKQWQYVAGLADISTGELEMGFKFLSKNLDAARQGSKEAQENFRRLGVSMTDLQGATPDQIMLKAADAMGKIEDPIKRAALATQIFGRSGTRLLPLFQDDVRGLLEEAKAMGVEFSGHAVESTQEFMDNQQRLHTVLEVITETIGDALIPTINGAVHSFVEWWKVNKDLVRQPLESLFHGLAAAIAFAAKGMKVLLGFARGFLAVNRAWKNVPAWILAVAGAVLGVVAAVNVLRKSLWILQGVLALFQTSAITGWFAMQAAAVKAAWASFTAWSAAIGPLWLVIGAILVAVALVAILGLVVQDLWTWFKGGDSVIDHLSDKIAAFVDETVTYWKDQFGALWKWFTGLFENNFLFRAVASVTGLGEDVAGENPAGGRAGYSLTPEMVGQSMARGPDALAGQKAALAGQSHYNAQTKVDVNVFPTPGMSATDVGNAAARAAREAMDDANREALYGMSTVPVGG